MTKRAAMIFAGLVAVALLTGAAAFAGWVGGPSSVGAAAEPTVRTVERTITVHRRAEPSRGTVRVVELPGPATAPTPTWDDDHDAWTEDDHEGPDDEHEDEHPDHAEEHEDD